MKKKKWLIGVALLILIIIIRLSGIHHYITIEAIRENSQNLQNFIAYNYWLSVLFFVGAIALVVSFAIPLSVLLTIASGYFFGALSGALYSIVGATIGATFSFFTFRYLLRGSVQQKYGHMLEPFNKELKKRGASYLLFMQLLPITPFGIIIVITSLSHISWWTFVWATALGITPGSLIYTFAGRQFMHINVVSDILSWPIIIALILLALISLLPLFVRKFNASVLDQ